MTWDPDGGSPLVLVDFGDRMLAEPTLPQEHQVQTLPFLRSSWKTSWDRGGVSFETTFSKVFEFSTPHEPEKLYSFPLPDHGRPTA